MDTSTLLSRAQFAFTIGYHYLFPQLTMGLALLILILKTLYLWRKDERYNIAARFWARIFAITFIMGVVTGIPMEFQFGTNWARFSVFAGDIIAQTLAMEGAFAFFIESAFLGIFLFGEQVFGQKMHWFSSFMVWLGTWASGAFIIASNAWMQHPVGYTVAANGRLHISDYWAVLFNSWILPQYLHTMSGAVITGSFVMSGLGAYYLLTKKYIDYGRLFVTLGMIVGLLASGFQLFPSGDLEGLQVTAYQPVKLAAMEGLFQTEKGAQPYHDMIAIVEEFDIIWPSILWKGVEAYDLGGPAPVGQDAKHIGDDDGIIDCPVRWIGLADNDDTGTQLCVEKAFHRCKLDRLISRHLRSFQVSTGIQLDDAGDKPYDHPQGHKQAAVLDMPSA